MCISVINFNCKVFRKYILGTGLSHPFQGPTLTLKTHLVDHFTRWHGGGEESEEIQNHVPFGNS